MYLFLFYLVFLTINGIAIYAFQEKNIFENPNKSSFVISKIKYFSSINLSSVLPERKNGLASIFLLLGNSKKQKNTEAKRLLDLSIEKIQLNNKLKMLEFISDFEMYLAHNKIDKSRFSQMHEFNDLKFSTQKSILKSTRRISSLSTN
ncbi:hypothetical protein VP395_01930 [Mariniflexile soesokkakense]|uniref:Uncharacterized protein n=1 Tax=Mariniflexile soesokkakense TaxID=1343160 RepID=A0ABV0A8A4_9FLAO